MVTEITLGNFGQIGGKNVLTGGASKLDTKGLIEAQVKARRIPADRLETRNKTISSQTKAFDELKAIFTKFQSAANNLRNPPGVDTDSQNIFQYRKASLSSSTGVSPNNYVDVSVQPGTAAQNYTINSITQLATQTKQQSGVFSIADTTTASAVTANGSPVAGLFRAGTVNLRAVDGTVGGIALTLNEGDSLQNVASKFNEVSSRTGIQASILTVAPGSYRMIFTATQTGSTYGFDLGQTSPAAGFGVQTDASGVLSQLTFGTTQAAQNSIFSIDGVALTRENNNVSDVIEGLTLNLKQASVPGTLQINVVPDTEIASNAITQFADAYNEFRLFASRQAQLDDDSKPSEDAVLYNNTILRTFVNDISTQITGIVNGITGGNPSRLDDLGLKLENFDGDDDNPATKNILTVDTDKLNSILQTNFEGVRRVFEFQQSSDNTNFVTFKRGNNLGAVTNFSVSINAGVYTASYTDPIGGGVTTVNLDGEAIAGGGISLKGQSGTPFEGMEFVYASAVDATINVTITQGFADRFHNMLDRYLDDDNGVLVQEVESMNDVVTRNQEEITRLDAAMEAYREQLVQQYALLESALTSANQILQLLDAQANSRNNS
jgi:flagellar hook-associated protein 2